MVEDLREGRRSLASPGTPSTRYKSTPHSISKDAKDWQTLSRLPKLAKKLAPKRPITKDEVKRLARICERFEEVEYERPILCCYEQQESSFPSRFRSRRIKVIGADFCKINCQEPAFLQIEADFPCLTDISASGDVFRRLSVFIRESMTRAQFRIMMSRSQRETPQMESLEADCL
ncbi:MAG: hypothetical protein Q9207_006363 [Kuettlingeria erythrocarpa]